MIRWSRSGSITTVNLDYSSQWLQLPSAVPIINGRDCPHVNQMTTTKGRKYKSS